LLIAVSIISIEIFELYSVISEPITAEIEKIVMHSKAMERRSIKIEYVAAALALKLKQSMANEKFIIAA